MKIQGSRNRSIMVAFVFAILVLCSQAQAAGFRGGDRGIDRDSGSRPAINLLEQASAWLHEAWGGLTSVFASSETPAPPAPQTCTPGTPGCDAGWGLDPEG